MCDWGGRHFKTTNNKDIDYPSIYVYESILFAIFLLIFSLLDVHLFGNDCKDN